MSICGLDGRSKAPRDGFMASRIIDTEQLRVARLSFDGNQEILYYSPTVFEMKKEKPCPLAMDDSNLL